MKNPLLAAIYDLNFDHASYLLTDPSNHQYINKPDEYDGLAIFAATDLSQYSELSADQRLALNKLALRLITLNVDLNTTQEGLYPIHYLCAQSDGDIALLRAMIEKGCDPNISDVVGETPLHIALKSRHEKFVVYLLSLPNIKLATTRAIPAWGKDSKTVFEYAQQYYPEMLPNLYNCLKEACIVNIATQTMRVKTKSFNAEYPVSTSRNGIGNISGSFKTPLGHHKIADKFGAFAPLYSVFNATGTPTNTEQICNELNIPRESDLVLTRVIRLQGLEPGINAQKNESGDCVDSFEREIWIHGTNREDLIAEHKPGSIGCIRMNNKDIERLFLKLKIDTPVIIVNHRPKPCA